MRRVWLVFVLGACNFGTLDSLSEDTTSDAPPDMTTVARKFWTLYEKGSDDDIKLQMSSIGADIDRTGAIPIQDKMGDITADDLATIGFAGKDTSAAQGMLSVTEMDCPLEKIEPYIIALNQTTLYPKLYSAYDRTYTSSEADYVARQTPRLTWNTTYTGGALGHTWNASLSGSVRYLPHASPTGGPVLMERTYLTAPAVFTEGGEDSAFAQDYQIEVYFERTPGTTTHVYGMWRDFHLGDLTSRSKLYVALVLGNLADFDVRTAKVCHDGTPPPAFAK